MLDADLIVYRAGFAGQKTLRRVYHDDRLLHVFTSAADYKTWLADNPDIVHTVEQEIDLQPKEMCFAACKNMIEGICNSLGVYDVQAFLSASDNFRKEIDPQYKANRPPKPIHYKAIREYMEEAWSAMEVPRHEADDLLGIYQCRDIENSVIVSIDKDLDMIPGWHYNFVKEELYEIEETEGIRSFYKQLLRGDGTDNVAGLPPRYDDNGRRINESWVTHNRAIDDCGSERECWSYCGSQYRQRLGFGGSCGETSSVRDGEEIANTVLKTARLLWILREYNQVWLPPDEREPYF